MCRRREKGGRCAGWRPLFVAGRVAQLPHPLLEGAFGDSWAVFLQYGQRLEHEHK